MYLTRTPVPAYVYVQVKQLAEAARNQQLQLIAAQRHISRLNNNVTKVGEDTNNTSNTNSSTVYKHSLIDLHKTGRFHVWCYSTMTTKDDCLQYYTCTYDTTSV